LRQEYRELDLLDEIGLLRFSGNLPPQVRGIVRNELIRSYQSRRGDEYDPPNGHWHPAMKWQSNWGSRMATTDGVFRMERNKPTET
jgi:hypothetical protein